MAAYIVTYDQVGMSTADRCDRCGGQAYLEADLASGGKVLLCGHHADKHSDKLAEIALRIADHRPYLLAGAGAKK